ncbi:NaeI family type II restriction endonuclease [Streptomyces niveus]|uniref:NaeI family type II restriction endonuclease n=1 Tax=Streptomyces niveus TaxID=193462 RepID=UPI00343A47EA
MNALVLLLRGVRTEARLSVEDVHELLRTSGELKGSLPARSTLYRKLSGVGLKSERRLVEAIVGVCARDERQADALRKRAVDLLHQAWTKDAEPLPERPAVAEDNGGIMAELVRVQRELIGIQTQLAAALQAAAEAEKEAARSRALVTTLLVLGAMRAATAGHPSAHGSSSGDASGAEPFGLRTSLAAAETERGEAQQAARAAQRRLAEAEDLLAALALGSASAVPREWPTTRTDPVNRTSPASKRVGQAAHLEPDSTPFSAERVTQQLTMDASEHEERVQALKRDPALAAVLGEMVRLDPDGSRMRSMIDGAGQHLLDPAYTSRYLWSQLTKAEKTSFGTTLHQRMQHEFSLPDGRHLDFVVAGHEVDLKFSLASNWMFPPELQGGLCLLVQADDVSGRWSLGLLRVRPDLMHTGANRDGKRRLSARGKAAIHWIHHALPLPEHALRALPADVVEAIFAKPSGQARADELFLRAKATAITTADLAAVTMQADGAKRARDSRRTLAGRGVLILNGTRTRDVEWASGLGLPTPERNTWMSVRLVPSSPQHDGSPTIELDDAPWRLAGPDDPETPLPPGSLV